MKYIGFPVVANGIPVIGPTQSGIIKALDESHVTATRKRIESDAKDGRWKAGELNALYSEIVDHLEHGKIVDRTVTVNWRTKCHGYKSPYELQGALNSRFIREHGVRISSLNVSGHGAADDVPLCILSSVFCCCIPLLYWIPKWIVEDRVHVVTLRFETETMY
jgi:hypothetical protein